MQIAFSILGIFAQQLSYILQLQYNKLFVLITCSPGYFFYSPILAFLVYLSFFLDYIFIWGNIFQRGLWVAKCLNCLRVQNYLLLFSYLNGNSAGKNLQILFPQNILVISPWFSDFFTCQPEVWCQIRYNAFVILLPFYLLFLKNSFHLLFFLFFFFFF